MSTPLFDSVPDILFTPASPLTMPSEDAYEFYNVLLDQYMLEYSKCPKDIKVLYDLSNTMRFVYPYLTYEQQLKFKSIFNPTLDICDDNY